MKCPRHPKAESGKCWWCEGRPPGWKCNICLKHLPCDHIFEAPSLTRESSVTRSDLMRAVELYKMGTCDWRYVEMCLDRHEVEVRTAWNTRRAGGN